MTELVKVYLTTQQRNKMQGGKPFQLSATQLQAGSGKHAVEIQMTPKNHIALLKNVSNGKGYRQTKSRGLGSLAILRNLWVRKLQKQ